MIDAEELIQTWLKRPDLQEVYDASGNAKNPSDPRIQGIPTLMDWANRFGINENPNLDPTNKALSKYFTPDEIKKMPSDIKTGLSAFIDVQQKNFEMGKVNEDINAKNWNDAMATASQDPNILQKYGDELKTATVTTNRALQSLEAGFTEQEAATARSQVLERQNLQEAEAAQGRAYSGFREQAKTRLAKDQSDVIQSSRRTLQTDINNIVSPYEKRYGTGRLNQDVLAGKLKIPTISGIDYQKIGTQTGNELTGTADLGKKTDERNRATELYNTTVNPT
jgi:hypothetical protein